MAVSIIFYLLVLLIIEIMAENAEKKDNQKWLIYIIIILALVSGLRAESVGIDTHSYASIFESIKTNDVTLAWRNIERSFLVVCKIILSINGNNNFIFLIFSLLTNALIVLRLWDFKKVASLPWMLACYYVTFYFTTMNIVRQYCAIAIIFFATRYLMERKYFLYFAFILLAFLFHRSALLGLAFYALEVTNWKNLDFKRRMFIIVGIVTIPLYVGYIFANFERYLKYFGSINAEVGLMLPVKIVIYILVGLGIEHYFKEDELISCSNNRYPLPVSEFEMVRLVKYYYIIGILATFLGYFFSFMDRIGLVFYLFECVFWGIAIKNRKDRVACEILCAAILIYILYSSFLGNGQGVLPYHFFWQMT